MNSKVSIIMYHYVRDLKNSKYPQIKGLDTSLFKEQISYIKKHYNFISVEDIITVEGQKNLPPKSILLTFDDGFIDHYAEVFPILKKEKIKAAFFPPAKTVKEKIVLDVHKVHFILANANDKEGLFKNILSYVEDNKEKYSLKSKDFYLEKYLVENEFDDKKTIFIKRMMQSALPEKLRNEICSQLFNKYVSSDEASFSSELYMSIDNLSEMHNAGMHIGSHGYEHYWLSSLTKKQQKIDIEKSISFLKDLGQDLNKITICFPYGDFNSDTLDLLSGFKFKAGFSTKVKISNLKDDNILALPRLDTNHIPKSRYEKPNEWWQKG